MALLRVLRRLFGHCERPGLALVGQIVMRMAVTVPLVGDDDGLEPEIAFEHLVECRLVTAVLDQRDAQRTAQRLAVGEGARLGRRTHGVECLGYRHPQPMYAQQPDESVQAAFHRPGLQRASSRKTGRERPAALSGRYQAAPGSDRRARRRRTVVVLVVPTGPVHRMPLGAAIRVLVIELVRPVRVSMRMPMRMDIPGPVHMSM